MEYVKFGKVFDYIVEKGRLQQDEARDFCQQIDDGILQEVLKMGLTRTSWLVKKCY